MTSRDFEPYRLDVAAFAKEGARLEGRWPLAQFDRLTDASTPESTISTASDVIWSVRGERRVLRGGDAQIWLHVVASTDLALECQRCLTPVDVHLHIERKFMFVHGEDAAAQLDAQSEDDVMQLTRALDLRELVEDELLLALPLVPRHSSCPVPVRLKDAEDKLDEAPNPFAALAHLKQPGSLN